ncbi:MAG TPA: hypothetical protein VFE86_06095 [Ilumatobacteraceae bacterium]|nr:hypothetical protein [Ilumatobacteraceae bacterium]
MKSRVRLIAGATLVAASVIAATAGVSLASGHDQTVLKADVLVGVTGPYTGAKNPIRGINGGGVPWAVGESEVRLRASGKIEAEIHGLVLVATGTNPVANFKLTVSCQTIAADGTAAVANVSTENMPTGPTGDASIETTIALPSPCIAPIIFVANGNAAGAWFAATGV